MIKTIIVDDEPHCIDHLTRMIRQHCPATIQLSGTFDNISDAAKGIQQLQPELVLLDVQLQDNTGFDLLTQLPVINFQTIFTTAYEKYAVEAFRFSAMDYLLKPVESAGLVRAIQKVAAFQEKDKLMQQLEVLYMHLQPERHSNKKITIPTLNGLEFLSVNEIIRCQAESNYTQIFLKGKPPLVVTRSLKEFETLLEPYGFFRIHHSHLINLYCIKKYQKGKGGFAVLDDGSEIEVSTRRKEAFLQKLKEL